MVTKVHQWKQWSKLFWQLFLLAFEGNYFHGLFTSGLYFEFKRKLIRKVLIEYDRCVLVLYITIFYLYFDNLPQWLLCNILTRNDAHQSYFLYSIAVDYFLMLCYESLILEKYSYWAFIILLDMIVKVVSFKSLPKNIWSYQNNFDCFLGQS